MLSKSAPKHKQIWQEYFDLYNLSARRACAFQRALQTPAVMAASHLHSENPFTVSYIFNILSSFPPIPGMTRATLTMEHILARWSLATKILHYTHTPSSPSAIQGLRIFKNIDKTLSIVKNWCFQHFDPAASTTEVQRSASAHQGRSERLSTSPTKISQRWTASLRFCSLWISWRTRWPTSFDGRIWVSLPLTFFHKLSIFV